MGQLVCRYATEGSPSQVRTAQFTANDTLILSSCADDKAGGAVQPLTPPDPYLERCLA
jgi:hypothetical protein